MEFKFTIEGHPVPYTRTTQKQKWVDKRWQKYLDYRAKTQAAFLESLGKQPMKSYCASTMMTYNKPLNTKSTKMYVSVKMYFKNKQHGDPDNIMKGILDAIFVSDKYCAGAFDFFYDKEYPRVEIVIESV